ncbi:hypothetical protein CG432_19415 [Pantoea ananatis]|nr:hypothetical protein CG432_19415 [Pantoea ananatis]
MVYRFTGLQVYRFTGLQVYRFTGLQVYRFTGLQETISPTWGSPIDYDQHGFIFYSDQRGHMNV